MSVFRNTIFLSLALFLMTACASGPGFRPDSDARDLTPEAVVTHPGASRLKTVVWGGVIVSANNLESSTRLEILTYPLDSQQYPGLHKPAQGRFIAEHDGYLETVDYSLDRLVTVQGRVISVEDGKVGDADYRFPVVKTRNIHLWPRQSRYRDSDSRFRFGFGVILSN